MSERPTRTVAVILETAPANNRWEDFQWRLVAAVPDVGGEARDGLRNAQGHQRIFPGLELTLFQDEAEGYYLNASSGEPSVFVSIRFEETTGHPYAFMATLSYNEAARRMDGGERVERVPAWPELAAWLSDWVELHYKPEPKRRRKPESFKGKEGRLRERS